jgi:putative membrane-bound dehydrogenase-like protein
MHRVFGLCLVVLLLLLAPARAQREFGFDNTKPSGQPYISPEETVKRFKVAPEFEVKLFAGEPLMTNPIAFTIDEKGRVWLIECFEYPKRTPKGQKPRDRIVILEDTNGDGVADKRTVFAEGKDFPETFDLASGIEVGHGGVFVGAPPYLWFIENKDDKPGKFEILLKGFGSQDTHETLNTFQWGPDGWLYGLHGVFTHSEVRPVQADGPATRLNAAVWRYHPKTKKFEVFAEGTSNPWGMDWRNTDGEFIVCCCVIPHLFHVVPGGIYKRQAGASFNPHAYGYIDEICDHTFHRESGWAHAGLISLDVPHMPEKYRNSVIFGSIHGCSIKQNILKPNGSTYIASKGEDFLVSGDKNFRPINLKWGPLGDIYLIDWHDQHPCHQTNPDDWDYERGRVYRIQLKGTQPKKAEDLGQRSLEELQTLANSAHPYEARTARRLLIERKEPTVIPPLTSIEDRFAKEAHALRIMFDQLALSDDGIKQLVETYRDKGLLDSAVVRRELASVAVRLADTKDVRPLLHALMARQEDAKDPVIPHLVWYAYEKVLTQKGGAASPAEAEVNWLTENAPGNAFLTERIVPRVTRRLASTGQPGDLALALRLAAEVPDTAARRKALEGLAAALQGQTVDAPPTWTKVRTALLAEKDDGITDLVNKLSVNFRDPQAFRRALTVLDSPRRAVPERVEAARQIAQLRHPESVKTLLRLVRGSAPEPIRLEAVRGLAGYDDKDIPQALVTHWRHLTPALRAEAVNTLAGRKEWAAALLSAMRENIIDRAAVTDNTILRIQAFNDRTLNNLIETAWGRTRATPAELAAEIDKMRGELARGPGSFTRGKAVFDAQCAKCHTFDGAGAEVGPPLDGAGRDIEYLLANILDPNRVIGAPYFIRQVATLDGQVLQGVLAEEDERTLTLKLENGVLRKIPKADIDGEVKVLEKSMMPEGLASSMTVQDFRDLVRYVMAHPFLTDVTVNGTATAAGVSGLIPLPPGKDDKPVTIEAVVTATDSVQTQLLVGSSAPFEVQLNGQPVGAGKGTGQRPEPDREAFEVKLPKGTHTLKLTVKPGGSAGGVYARFLDPDRKLRYPDAAESK